MNNLSVKNKLYLGFGTIVAIILLLLILAYNNFNRLSEANAWDKHTADVLLELASVSSTSLEVQNDVRGYLLTGDETYLASKQEHYEEMKQHLEKALRLTNDNPRQQERLKRAQAILLNWGDVLIQRQVDLRKELRDTKGAADAVGQSSALKEAVQVRRRGRDLLDETANEERSLQAERLANSKKLQETQGNLFAVGGAAVVVLSLLVSILLARAILGPLASLTSILARLGAGELSARVAVTTRDEMGQLGEDVNKMAQQLQDGTARELAQTNDLRAKVDALLETVSRAAGGDLTGKITVGGDDAIGQLGDGLRRMFDNLRQLLNNVQKAGIQVTTSATEIAASAKQQEATGVEQAQTSVEVLSTTKEISSNTSQLLKTMEDATAVADYTTSATSEAQGNLRRMDQTMQNMVNATDSINAKLAALSEKASNINSVLTTITKVADQTNILSLNAAIEAEKAGEAGRGFSVVATEIRRLADQTSVSTWDIEQMLKEMQSAVSASVMGMDKFSEEIRRSVGEVRQVTDQLSGVMDQVQKLAPQFDAVLQGMQAQAVGAQQITETMMQLNDATQQTVESLKATSEAVHQLQYAAGDLQTSVATFSVSA
ncbi:HAMP domain-containing protein [Pseudoduganella sp. DS3]|uniref:HAMP domain-containing protein n=1 Tax=Pseudoduganella guangdongensis TaxID=2692179 RepID=A0A6N9HP90_9BURK|nr:methyl-accepting chemotaxis protein [Pseudoduganella guangdongensis]MYN05294.1 HAMP domain-containing protein [Pseudoduganella guangdongensis]